MMYVIIKIILVILSVILSVIAIKITLTFDLNAYLQQRRQAKKEMLIKKAQYYCPHINIISIEQWKIVVRSSFISFPGTIMWVCPNCGLQRIELDGVEEQSRVQYWMSDLNELIKQKEKFDKIMKKLNNL